MKKIVAIVISIIPSLLNAQDIAKHETNLSDQIFAVKEDNGIRWTETLSWKEVKEKARNENKYIFLDCYATWCAPCKRMDAEVYTDNEVGNYFNSRFISVKVQMDKTKNDNEFVKNWYNDAETLNNDFHLQGYPSFIFFTPAGVMVHTEVGFKTTKQLIEIAELATKPGKVYDNPYAEYDQFVEDYNRGIKNYRKMLQMSKKAEELGKRDLSKQLRNEHTDYISELKPEDRYTKEDIEIWSSKVFLSTNKIFSFFYKDAEIINKVMNRKGYAESMVDKAIQYEIVDSFYKMHGRKEILSSLTSILPSIYWTEERYNPDYSETDWQKLYKMILANYSSSYAERNVLEAKVKWYEWHRNYPAFVKYYLEQLDKYPPDLSDFMRRYALNYKCFHDVFMNISDKKILLRFAKWMKKSLDEASKIKKDDANHLDTYANLLYKAGREKLAIKWQEKAVSLRPGQYFKDVLDQMRKGFPTNLERSTESGASWEGISWVKWDGFYFKKAVLINDGKGQAAFGITVKLERTDESKVTIGNPKSEYGLVIFDNVCVGDVLIVYQEGKVVREIKVGKKPVASIVTLATK